VAATTVVLDVRVSILSSKLLVNHHRSTMLITCYNLGFLGFIFLPFQIVLFLQVKHACTILLYWPAGVHRSLSALVGHPVYIYSVNLVLLHSYCLLGFSSPLVA
jgi:hypothetical protein